MVTNTYRLMIMDGLKERYPEYEFYTQKVTKNNGYCYNGIFVKLDETIPYAPIIPCEEYEEALACDVMTVEEILDEIDKLLQTRFLLKNIPVFDFEQIKDKLRVRVVNYKKNQRRFKDMPHKQFFDLAIICRIVFVIDDNTEASIVVENRLLSAWKITEEVLFEAAYQNTFQDNPAAVNYQFRRQRDFPETHSVPASHLPEACRFHKEMRSLSPLHTAPDSRSFHQPVPDWQAQNAMCRKCKAAALPEACCPTEMPRSVPPSGNFSDVPPPA